MTDILSPTEVKSNKLSELAPNLGYLSEETIIRSLLGFPNCLDDFAVTAEFFYHKEFRIIADMVLAQKQKNAPVSAQLMRIAYAPQFQDPDFAAFFDELWKQRYLISNKHLGYYVDTLKEIHFKNSFDALRLAAPKGETVGVQVSNLIEGAKELLIRNVEAVVPSFEEDWNKVVQIAQDASEGIFPHCLNTHYRALDNIIGEGILDDYLVIVGADSGAGKTTFALNVIRNIAEHSKNSTLYMSFEMGRTRLMRWFMACCMQIPMTKFVKGLLTEDDWRRICAYLHNRQVDPLIIVETFPELTNVINAIRYHVKLNPDVRLVAIDHLHLMNWSKSSNPTDVVSMITKSLKQLAMELNVPILLLSQLKKPDAPIGGGSGITGSVPDRRDPHVSDLKGSGSIITDADLIMILQIDPSTKLSDDVRLVRNYVLKNRGGRTDTWVGFAHHVDKCLMTSN